MGTLDLIAIVLGIDVAVISSATIVARSWVKANRVDKMEQEINGLWSKLSKVDVLEAKLGSVEDHIKDIKVLLQQMTGAR